MTALLRHPPVGSLNMSSWRGQPWPIRFYEGVPAARLLVRLADHSFVVNLRTGFKCAQVTPTGTGVRSIAVVDGESLDAPWTATWTMPCGPGARRRARRLAERSGRPVLLISRRGRLVEEVL